MMATGLEQTPRNSAILGWRALWSIFASLATFFKITSPAPKKRFTTTMRLSETKRALHTDPKLPFPISSLSCKSDQLNFGNPSKYPSVKDLQQIWGVLKAMMAFKDEKCSTSDNTGCKGPGSAKVKLYNFLRNVVTWPALHVANKHTPCLKFSLTLTAQACPRVSKDENTTQYSLVRSAK